MNVIFTCLLITVLSFTKFGISQKVAIIGNGNGAALCSYFLHNTFPGVKIDVYNHKSQQNLIPPSPTHHSRNTYMSRILEGIHAISDVNGDRFVIIEDGHSFPENVLKLEKNCDSRYFSLRNYIFEQFKKFLKIYEAQGKGRSFKTVKELLHHISEDLEKCYTKGTAKTLLGKIYPASDPRSGKADFERFIKAELVYNYYSDMDAHEFASLALLMFSEFTGTHRKMVKMSENNLASFMLVRNKDNIIENYVSKILRKNNSNYVVEANNENEKPYDFIILATPTANKILYDGFDKNIEIFGYRKAYTTSVDGKLSDKFKTWFKRGSDDYSAPIVNITRNQTYSVTNIQSFLYSITGLWKSSRDVISDYVFSAVIKEEGDFYVCPDYSFKEEFVKDAKFELGTKLYNAHALHSLHMGNEMLAIGAKNIALLMKKEIEIGEKNEELNKKRLEIIEKRKKLSGGSNSGKQSPVTKGVSPSAKKTKNKGKAPAGQ